MGKQDNSTAESSILVWEEFVLDHSEFAIVVLISLPLHDLSEILLALVNQILDQVNFMFSHHQLQFLFQQFDHAL